jgi:hypothetical protein
MTCQHYKPGEIEACEDCNPGRLTFAEAMALDPSEVEVMCKGGSFVLLSDDPMHWTLTYLRHARFRRAKPKRSRVQEMAETYGIDGEWRRSYGRGAEAAIRAACEYLRNQGLSEWSGKQFAGDVEREFLVPR